MKQIAKAILGISALALAACDNVVLLIGKDDAEIATVLGEEAVTAPAARAAEPAAIPTGGGKRVFIADATVIAMDGTPAVQASVLIEDGSIAAIGPGLEAPRDAMVIDASGLTLMPGLVDMHVHHYAPEDGPVYLANGVTSVRNMWGTLETARIDEGARLHARPGPRIYSPGPLMDGPEPIWGEGSLVVTGPEMARGAVRAQKAAGFEAIKLYEKLDAATFTAAVGEAKAAGMKVYAHTPLAMTVDEVIGLRIDSLEHLNNVQDALVPDDYQHPEGYDYLATWAVAERGKMDRLAQLFATNGVANAVTLEVTIGRYASTLDPEAFFEGEEGAYVPKAMRDWWMESAGKTREWATRDAIAEARAKQIAFVRALHEAGAPLLIGTDAPNPFVVPGFSLHGELASFREAGLSNREILTIATRRAAEFLGEGDSFGKVAKGMRADLLLVKGDPLSDLSILRRPEAVIAGGQVYDRDALDAMLREAKAKAAATY